MSSTRPTSFWRTGTSCAAATTPCSARSSTWTLQTTPRQQATIYCTLSPAAIFCALSKGTHNERQDPSHGGTRSYVSSLQVTTCGRSSPKRAAAMTAAAWLHGLQWRMSASHSRTSCAAPQPGHCWPWQWRRLRRPSGGSAQGSLGKQWCMHWRYLLPEQQQIRAPQVIWSRRGC